MPTVAFDEVRGAYAAVAELERLHEKSVRGIFGTMRRPKEKLGGAQ
jgi:hypothetical protein